MIAFVFSVVSLAAGYITPEKTPKLKAVAPICDFDFLTWGSWSADNGAAIWQLTENIEGGGQATAVRAADLGGTPICWLSHNIDEAIDIFSYSSDELYLHFWMYIEDASTINGDGVIE